MKLLGVQITEEEFDYLMTEQSKGKELKVVDGKIITVDPVLTEEEIRIQELRTKKKRLEELTRDFAQVQVGFFIEDIEERKLEFQKLLNEVRVLQNKEPRKTLEQMEQEKLSEEN